MSDLRATTALDSGPSLAPGGAPAMRHLGTKSGARSGSALSVSRWVGGGHLSLSPHPAAGLSHFTGPNSLEVWFWGSSQPPGRAGTWGGLIRTHWHRCRGCGRRASGDLSQQQRPPGTSIPGCLLAAQVLQYPHPPACKLPSRALLTHSLVLTPPVPAGRGPGGHCAQQGRGGQRGSGVSHPGALPHPGTAQPIFTPGRRVGTPS